jgi:hypothetical protein
VTRFVIDAPTLVHLVDAQVAVHPDHRLVAPGSIRSDALALLLRDVRAGRRTDAEVRGLHERLTEVKLRLLGDRVSRATAYRVAREQDWDDLRDAEHVAITRLQADAFATVDEAMAARVDGLVPLVPVSALEDPPA